jgi:hypothetical protein
MWPTDRQKIEEGEGTFVPSQIIHVSDDSHQEKTGDDYGLPRKSETRTAQNSRNTDKTSEDKWIF